MEKVAEKTENGGKVQILQDFDKHLFLAMPRGMINPTLLEEDLRQARAFSEEVQDHWSYVTNTEHVRLVNPLNLLFLKEVKKLKKLKQIVIFAPGLINRLLIRAAFFIIQPDRIIKNKQEFRNFLETVS